MRIGKAETIRNIDSYCINELKIPSIVLMENAALKVLKHIDFKKYNDYIIVSGKGNNGGDALAIARHLISENKKVRCFVFGNGQGSQDFMVNYNVLKNIGVEIININKDDDLRSLERDITERTLVIDGIFGTGLKRKVEGIYKNTIKIINEKAKEVLAIDIPSGIHTDSGEILGIAIKASKTISFVMYKRGFLNYNAISYLGEVVVESIGMPNIAINKFNEKEFLVSYKFIKDNLKKRSLFLHKGDCGRVVIFGGSKGFAGAAVIATNAAIKSGAGLVKIACDSDVYNSISCRVLEGMCLENNSKDVNIHIQRADAIAIGPGMGNKGETLDVLSKVLELKNCPIVIDADGINVLQNNLELLKNHKKHKIVLTPHLGEMSRISGIPIEEIKKNRIEIAKKFAKENNVILLLKGFNTIITDGEELYINSTGNSSMANGGMGDCLTGIITSLVAQGYETLKATIIATYIHGYIGSKLSEEQFVVNASDIINKLPFCLNEFLN